jgi:glycosyltransferase involved in cell wall biosynthesis
MNLTNLPMSLDEVPLPSSLPPVILTVFTRPDLLKEVLKGLTQQTLSPPQIIAYVDGARSELDLPLIDQTIALLQEFSSKIPVDIRLRSQNLGCDQNVILAFTEILSTYESIVYLEDDDFPNPYFYDSMCRLLEAYREHKKIFSISGYATFPEQAYPLLEEDFALSRRVFSWGFGIWADRWNDIALINQSKQYNPFGKLYNIPATVQTKMTIINQFWLERNGQTDWVITLTLASLYQDRVHLIPKTSLIYNIGFGHPESKSFKDKEPSWVNSAYSSSFCPNSLPSTLELIDLLKNEISGIELAHYLYRKGVYIDLEALFYYLKKYRDLQSRLEFVKLFMAHSPFSFKKTRRRLGL